jgi:tRNA dimethylallyltransferase
MAPLIVITGPTASGKTGLALDLAERYHGEIICADSRTIYTGMDIGTAKPTKSEQELVPHHLLDVAEPGQKYTAANFQTAAYGATDAIRSRGNVPFLVGGTGLYIDAVIREYRWPETITDIDRDALEAYPTAELQTMIKNQHLTMPTNQANRRHLINTLMRSGNQGLSLNAPRENTVVVAIATDISVLENRIRERAHMMFEQGVVEEAKVLAHRYGWDLEAMSSNIYPILRKVIEGHITEQQAIELFVIKDRQLAKRQITWLKRHDYVKWLTLDDAKLYLEQILDSGYASIEQE